VKRKMESEMKTTVAVPLSQKDETEGLDSRQAIEEL